MAFVREKDAYQDNHNNNTVWCDKDISATYEGNIIRCGSEEASVFHIRKSESFFMIIVIPKGDTYYPMITVIGSLEEAERFLFAFKLGGGTLEDPAIHLN